MNADVMGLMKSASPRLEGRTRASTDVQGLANQLTIEQVLESENASFAFYLFLKHSQAEENYLLYRAIRDFKETEDPKSRTSKGRRIYANFLKPNAKKSANVEFSREKVEAALKSENPPKNLFEAQEDQARLYLINLYHLRFVNSEEHRVMKTQRENFQKSQTLQRVKTTAD